MKVIFGAVLLTLLLLHTLQLVNTLCVLESDFGVIINCAFKKSTLFRVRNLGGVKAHITVGLSIGDELGFKESISNIEQQSNRRRAVKGSRLDAQLVEAQKAKNKNQLVIPSPSSSSVVEKQIGNNTSPSLSIRSKNSLVAQPAAANKSINEQSSEAPSSSTEALSHLLASLAPYKPISAKTATTFSEDKPILNSIPPFKPLPPLSSEYGSAETSSEASTNSSEISSESYEDISIVPETTSTSIHKDDHNGTLPLNVTQKTSAKRSKSPPRSNRVRLFNAPKEYFPLGYDRQFNEDYASKVKLPKTPFKCRDQKHFPGLYADVDLGCLVFHVCVDMGNGIVGKSYLCPESTLFDQSILKCNWWFYVDCNKAKEQYDSNYPLSRSYQIMRALAFLTRNRRVHQETTAAPKEED